MITPVVKELKRVSPHGTRLVAPSAPRRRPLMATTLRSTAAVHGATSSHRSPATR
jgi:hypothetical protein